MKDIVSAAYYKDGRFQPKTGLTGDCSEHEIYYEVIRIKDGVPLFLTDHLQRLDASLKNDRKMQSLLTKVRTAVSEFLIKHPVKEGNLKVLICFKGVDFSLIVYQVAHHYPDKAMYESGVRLSCSALQRSNPMVKKWNQQMKQQVLRKKSQQDVFEILLSDGQGRITEGSKSNVFFISGRKVITAPEHLVLPGITRQKVLEIAGVMNLEISYKAAFCSELTQMEGAFLTGTSPKVLPVCRIDEVKFSVKSELMKEIMKRYDDLIEAEFRKA